MKKEDLFRAIGSVEDAQILEAEGRKRIGASGPGPRPWRHALP